MNQYISIFDPEASEIAMLQNPRTPTDKQNRDIHFTFMYNSFFAKMAQRCGGKAEGVAGVDEREIKNLLEVSQTIALLSTISEREKDQNVVTLSTLHAAKGLEWPHVILAGINEGLLPFKADDEEMTAQRLEEERLAKSNKVDSDALLGEMTA